MKVAIVKYNAGNVESVKNALNRLQISPVVTDDAEILSQADKVIFPGVGEASSAMEFLRANKLDSVVKMLRQPVLGICLGMQLLCQTSEENAAECLGIVPAKVHRFKADDYKIPQIGWNNIYNLKGKLFESVAESSYAYFVHGFYVEINQATSAFCEYSLNFSAALEYENFFAVQFHPEKSGEVGERILDNFLKL